MIYNREESEVAVLGEVQKYKVGIDERNINHIVTILSSNLYSHPMESFLRETVSNAVDSHIEAKSEEPIVITVTQNDIAIKDYGTGISPDRFKEIYLNIGSSTKRESNDYIGHFGLGRFSCLSVSDIANITSFYNGKAYYYVMNKDVDQLHIDLLYEKDTTEHNGVEVKVPIKSFDTDALGCLSFIDNVYVEYEGNRYSYKVKDFNERKILSYNNFKLLNSFSYSLRDTIHVLLGKIPYVVDYNSLWDYNDDWHKSWKEAFYYIYPQIEIGQVDITPNRESLLYSEKTKEVLRKAFDACIEELKELWDIQCKREYDDFGQFANRITSYIDNKLDLGERRIPVSRLLEYNAIYKKYPQWNNIPAKTKKEHLNCLLNHDIDALAILEGDTLKQGQGTLRWFTIKKLFQNWINYGNRKIISLPSKAGFSSPYFKGYLASKYGSNDLLILRTLHIYSNTLIRRIINSIFGASDLRSIKSKEERQFIFQIIRELLLFLSQHIEVTDVCGTSEYTAYKKANSIKNDRVVFTENINFTITVCAERDTYKTTKRLDEIVNYAKNIIGNNKSHIVYANLDSPFIEAFKVMKYPNLIILSAAKGKMPLLQKGLPEWIKPIESLYSPDNRVLQKYAAMRYILSVPHVLTNLYASSFMLKPIRDCINKLREYTNTYRYKREYGEADPTSIINIVPEEKYDSTIMALYNQCSSWIELSYRIDNVACCTHDYYAFYLLMKKKAFRMDYEYYLRVKEKVNQTLNAI